MTNKLRNVLPAVQSNGERPYAGFPWGYDKDGDNDDKARPQAEEARFHDPAPKLAKPNPPGGNLNGNIGWGPQTVLPAQPLDSGSVPWRGLRSGK